MEHLETDYLVVGAGAMGLAFADEILTRDPNAYVIMLDRRAKPGGHWNDAYPFVSLHQPAAFYGVNSLKLGSGGSDLASGFEVLSYFEQALEKMQATGRLQYFPMCEYRGNDSFVSTIARDKTFEVTVRKKTVDSTYMNVQVPATTPPRYEVSSEVSLVPINGLAKVDRPRSGYVIVGAGKTGIDAVLYLLSQQVDPDDIMWIMPNDAWLTDRALIQPGRSLDGLVTQLRIISESTTLEEIFLALEAERILFRLDEEIWPRKYRCATVSRQELAQLRKVREIIRKGRIVRIETGRIELERGELKTDNGMLYVDCTADPLAKREARPVFNGRNITLQSVSMCQQVFSASLIAYVETHYDDDVKKNDLCRAVPHPEFNQDLLIDIALTLSNAAKWTREFPLWLLRSRLSYACHEPLFTLITRGLKAKQMEAGALKQIRAILEQEFPEEALSPEIPASS